MSLKPFAFLILACFAVLFSISPELALLAHASDPSPSIQDDRITQEQFLNVLREMRDTSVGTTYGDPPVVVKGAAPISGDGKLSEILALAGALHAARVASLAEDGGADFDWWWRSTKILKGGVVEVELQKLFPAE